MDAHLAEFLQTMRPRLRAPNRPACEEVAHGLAAWFRHRRRRAADARAADVRGVVAEWYVGQHEWTPPSELRRFLAAVRLFAQWHSREWGAGRGRRFRSLVRGAVRDARLASRAAAKLDAWPEPSGPGRGRGSLWQVTLRGREHVVLRDLSRGDCVGPVGMPPDLVRTLPAGAVLDVRLREQSGAWHVASRGTCYPALVTAGRRLGAPAGGRHATGARAAITPLEPRGGTR